MMTASIRVDSCVSLARFCDHVDTNTTEFVKVERFCDLIDPDIYTQEYGHIRGCYMDHAGAALYTRSVVNMMSKDLTTNHYCNPHSNSGIGKETSDAVDTVRARVLEHFNTSADHYTVIFTSGATHSLQIVAESFDFSGTSTEENNNHKSGAVDVGQFAYLQHNHTSVLGMRNVDNVTKNNVPVRGVAPPDAFATIATFCEHQTHLHDTAVYKGNSLFVYPAQCNFSGFKYPLYWVPEVQKGALENKDTPSRWFCLLDAAAYVSTNQLDLSVFQPDFVCISFYKMFGLPTGVGALIVRNSSAHVLHKKYYGGGTVKIAMSSSTIHHLRANLHEKFEDGTINFLSILALRHGLEWLRMSGLNMTMISDYCYQLARYLVDKMKLIHHSNTAPAVCIYANTDYEDPETQGAIVNFNLLKDDGSFVGYSQVLDAAEAMDIHLRTGCFCNPGACQEYLGISDEDYYKNYSEAGHICGDNKDLINGHPTGSVRVSFGPYSRQTDVDLLLYTITEYFVTKPVIYQEPHWWTSDADNDTDNIDENLHVKTECDTPELPPEPVSNLILSEVNVYPIKSCGAVSVDSWPLEDRGLKYDRCWMIVNNSGVAYTLKQNPRLCLIKPRVNLEHGLLTLTFEGHSDCSVPLNCEEEDHMGTKTWMCHSKVCGDAVIGIDCGPTVASWINLVLGENGLRLIRQNKMAQRESKTEAGGSLALSNQAQFLMINENSVSWLSEQLPASCDCSKDNLVDRFRSNLVFTGNCPAFEEEHWTNVTIGCISFKVDSLCRRCKVISIDPMTGQRSKEPMLSLMARSKSRIKFGIYLSFAGCLSDNPVINVGDQVVPTFT